MRVIFLDIDGVLNGHEFNEAAQSNSIDRPCMERLNRILRETKARIVISSAWRYMVHGGAMTVKGFDYLLRSHGMNAGCVIDVTCPDETFDGLRKFGDRWQQIELWLSQHPEVTSYVVLDDEPPGLIACNDRDRMVTTDGTIGLTDCDADKAIAILTGVQTVREAALAGEAQIRAVIAEVMQERKSNGDV